MLDIVGLDKWQRGRWNLRALGVGILKLGFVGLMICFIACLGFDFDLYFLGVGASNAFWAPFEYGSEICWVFCSMAGRFSEEENESKEGCGGLMIRFPVVPFLLFMFFTPLILDFFSCKNEQYIFVCCVWVFFFFSGFSDLFFFVIACWLRSYL